MAKNKFIDATLRFKDKFTGNLQIAIEQLNKQQKTINKVAGKITKTGKEFTKAGKSLTKNVTAPVIGLGVAAVKTAADFEKGMSNVQAVAGATSGEMDLLRDKAKEMGAKTKFSASESADAFSYMAMAGWKTKEMLDGIEGIMYLAGATGEDLALTSDIVTDALTAFGLKASDTNRFVNVLAQTANASNTSVSLMGETFKYVAPVAGALGYSIEDASVAIGLMANSGIKASNAGTALRSILTNMSKPGKSAKEAMEKLGLSLTDASGNMKPLNTLMTEMRGKFAGLSEAQKAQYAASLAGKTGMSGLLAIVNSSQKDFDSLTASINNSAGAAEKMYNVANDNLNGKLTILKSTVESVAISFGDRLTPYVGKLSDYAQKLADKINGLSDEQIDLIVKIAGVAAAVGPVLLIVGKMLTVGAKLYRGMKKIGAYIYGFTRIKEYFGAFGTILKLLPMKFYLILGAVVAVAAAAILIYKNWDKIKALFGKIGAGIKNFVNVSIEKFKIMAGKFSEFVAFSKAKGTYLGAIFQNIGNYVNGVKQTFKGLITFVKGVFTGDWKSAWEGVKSIFSGIFGTLGAVVKAPINGVIGIINSAIGHINKIKITVPKWVPETGGKTFGGNIPKIPLLYQGTNYFSGGRAFIHDQGAEIVDLPRGTRVIPHDKSIQTAYKQGMSQGSKVIQINKIADTVVVRSDDDIDRIAEKLAEKLKEADENGGGNPEAA